MTEAVLSPDETRLLSIWGLLGKRRVPILRWSAAIFFGAAAWLGGLAVISQFRPNEIWKLLSGLGSHSQIYLACLGASATVAVVALLARQRAIAALGFAAAGFLGSFWASGLLYGIYRPDVNFPIAGMADAVGFAIMRLWWAIPAFVLLGAAALIFRGAPGEPRPHLGFGNWSVEARDVNAKEKPYPYWRRLFIGFVIVSIVIFVSLQATVGFRPILSGKFIALLPGVLLVALVNSAVEEMVFRGFMQPAFVRVLGAGAGIWTASALFGIVHWGISVGVLAALPVSLAIALGSVVWGKAAYDTKGLGWPIAAHFLVDIAVMGAYFV